MHPAYLEGMAVSSPLSLTHTRCYVQIEIVSLFPYWFIYLKVTSMHQQMCQMKQSIKSVHMWKCNHLTSLYLRYPVSRIKDE